MGPDGKGTAQAAAYIDGQPVQYAGEITLPDIVAFRVRGKIIKETFQGVEVSQ